MEKNKSHREYTHSKAFIKESNLHTQTYWKETITFYWPNTYLQTGISLSGNPGKTFTERDLQYVEVYGEETEGISDSYGVVGNCSGKIAAAALLFAFCSL